MNVVLAVINTLRAEHLGCYGYFRNTSPYIDKLTKGDVLFENFHASAVATGSDFTSIFTGLFPIQNKFYLSPQNLPNFINFDNEIPTLLEIIWENGSWVTPLTSSCI